MKNPKNSGISAAYNGDDKAPALVKAEEAVRDLLKIPAGFFFGFMGKNAFGVFAQYK